MGDAEACIDAGYAAIGSNSVAAPLTQKGSKKQNGYAKRVVNGNHAEGGIYKIFGFPKYKKRGRNQPDILFADSDNKRFVGEIKSLENDRIVVLLDQFARYEGMAPQRNGKKYNLFYFFAVHNGTASDINDVYVVDYVSMKRLFETKEHFKTRWKLKKRFSQKIDCAEEAGQKLVGYHGRMVNNDGRRGEEIREDNKKDIIERHNKKGEHIRICESDLSEFCPNSRRVWNGFGVQNIAIHYNDEMDFIRSAGYPVNGVVIHKKKPVQTALFKEQ